jgi:hypothetical protein
VNDKDTDRRNQRGDRRRHPRGGRRGRERRARWQRLTWLFFAYAIYLALRAPAAIRRAFRRHSS